MHCERSLIRLHKNSGLPGSTGHRFSFDVTLRVSVRQHLFDQLSREQQAQLREICDTLLEHLLPIASSRGDAKTRLIERARGRLDATSEELAPT